MPSARLWTALSVLLLTLSPSTLLVPIAVFGNAVQISSTSNIPDFSVSLNPTSLTILQGGTGQAKINLTSHNNFAGSIFWSSIGSDGPFGVSVLNGTNIRLRANATWISTLVVDTTTWDKTVTGTGEFSASLSATSGSITHSVTASVVIISSPAPTSDFSFKISSDRIQLSPGGSQTSTITLASIRGYNGNVSLTAVVGCLYGSCPHPTYQQTPFNLTVDDPVTSSLQISTDPSLPPADYLIIMNGIGTARFHSVPVVITVTSPSLSMDYQVASFKQQMTVPLGSSQTAEITFTSVNGFAGEVQVAPYICCGELPTPNISYSLNSSKVTLSPGHAAGSITLTVTVTGPLPENATIFVIGSVGTLHRRWSVLTVFPGSGQDFAIGVIPGLTTINQGTKPTNTNLLYIYSNTTSTIYLATSVTPSTGKGPTVTLGNYTVVPRPGRTYTSPINVSALETTPAQQYTIMIRATSGSISHETSFSLIVEPIPAPDYDLSLNSSSTLITQGGTVNITASVSAPQSNLYHYNASLSVTINPNNNISPTNFTKQLPLGYRTNQYSTLLSIQSPSSTPAGTVLSVNVTGQIGSIHRTASLSLTIKSSSSSPGTPGSNTPGPNAKTAEQGLTPSRLEPYLLAGLAVFAVLVAGLVFVVRRKNLSSLS